MVEKEKNQKDIMDQELINSFGIDYIFDSKPINRIKNKPTIENTNSKLNALKEKINNINNDTKKIYYDFKLIFIDSFTKLNTDQKSSDKIVSDIVKTNLKKIMKKSLLKEELKKMKG